MRFPKSILQAAKAIEIVSFDVDGVLTDGKLYYNDVGEEQKAFHVHDGSAIKLLRENNIEVALITGRNSPAVSRRAEELGIPHVFQGVQDKSSALSQLLQTTKLAPNKVAHVGDDLPDIAMFDAVGLSISVPNGHPVVRDSATYVTETGGGEGVAREVCELMLRAKEKWPHA